MSVVAEQPVRGFSRTFEQYVIEGRRAKAAMESAGWELARLAAGVQREYGALARWAREVGISKATASELRSTWEASAEGSVDRTLPIWTANALRAIPDEDRAAFLSENPNPSQRQAKEAARSYRAKESGYEPREEEPEDAEWVVAPAEASPVISAPPYDLHAALTAAEFYVQWLIKRNVEVTDLDECKAAYRKLGRALKDYEEWVCE